MEKSIQQNNSIFYLLKKSLQITFWAFCVSIAFTSACIAQSAPQERALNEWAKKVDEARAQEQLDKLEGRRKISDKEWDSASNLLFIFLGIGALGWIVLRLSDYHWASRLVRKENEEQLTSIVEKLTNIDSRNISKIGKSEIAKMDLKTIADSLHVPLLKTAKGLEILEWDCLDYSGSKTIDFKKIAKHEAKGKTSDISIVDTDIYKQLLLENRMEFLKNKERKIPIEDRDIVIRLIANHDYTGSKFYFGFFDEKHNCIANCEGWYTDFAEESYSTKKSAEIFYDAAYYFDPLYHFTLVDVSNNSTMFYLNRRILPKNCRFITLNFYPTNIFNEFVDSLEVQFWPSGLSETYTNYKWQFNSEGDKFFQLGLISINQKEVIFLHTSNLVENISPQKLGKSIKTISKKFPWIE